MSTFGDIRVKFQNEQLRFKNQREIRRFLQELGTYFELSGEIEIKPQKQKYVYESKSKSVNNQFSLRYSPLDPNQNQIEFITNVLNRIDGFPNFQINEYLPGQIGSASSKYITYEIVLQDKFVLNESISPNNIYITVALSRNGVLRDNDLKPQYFELDGKINIDHNSIRNQVAHTLNQKLKKYPDFTKFVLHIFDLVKNHNMHKTIQPGGLSNEVIQIIDNDPNTMGLYVSFKDDFSIIAKNFGEILGGVIFSKLINQTTVTFPTSNARVFDFEVDGIKVSSKYKNGAGSSVTGLVETYRNMKQKPKLEQTEQELLDLFEKVEQNQTAESYLEVADFLKNKGLNESRLYDALYIYFKSKNVSDFLQQIQNLDSKNNPEVYDFINQHLSKRTRGIKGLKTNIFNHLIYIIATESVNSFNQIATQDLSRLIEKLQIHQIKMDFNIQKQLLKFVFLTEKVNYEFNTKISSNSFAQGKLAFKMK